MGSPAGWRIARRERLAPGSPAGHVRSPRGDRRRDAVRSRRPRTRWPRPHRWIARRFSRPARSPSRRAGTRPAGTPRPRRRARCCGCPARPAGRCPGTGAAADRWLRRAGAGTEVKPAGTPPATRWSAGRHAPPLRRDRASSRRPRPPGAGPSSETTGRTSPHGSCPIRRGGFSPLAYPGGVPDAAPGRRAGRAGHHLRIGIEADDRFEQRCQREGHRSRPAAGIEQPAPPVQGQAAGERAGQPACQAWQPRGARWCRRFRIARSKVPETFSRPQHR